MSDMSEIRGFLAGWVEDKETQRRTEGDRFDLLLNKLADLWSMPFAEVLEVAYSEGWFWVNPNVGKIARWFEGRSPRKIDEAPDDEVPAVFPETKSFEQMEDTGEV